MKQGLIGAALLLALGISCLAFSAEPRVGKFMKYDAGEYVIVTSRSGAQARRIREDLVKFRSRSNACWANAQRRMPFRPSS